MKWALIFIIGEMRIPWETGLTYRSADECTQVAEELEDQGTASDMFGRSKYHYLKKMKGGGLRGSEYLSLICLPQKK